MVAVHQSTVSDTSNPEILLLTVAQQYDEGDGTRSPGFLIDPLTLEYSISSYDGTVLVSTTSVDLVNERIAVGTFAPSITVGAAWGAGRHYVSYTWTFDYDGGVSTRTETTSFIVVETGVPIVDGYAQVSDARDEGVPAAFSDQRIKEALESASRTLELYTKRFFGPRYIKAQYDVKGLGILVQTDQPIIALEDVELIDTYGGFDGLYNELVDADGLRVYNRHMRGLIRPDDRQNPRIEVTNDWDNGSSLSSAGQRRLGNGKQSCVMTGWWGYTDPDGGPLGITPRDITQATMMLGFKQGIRTLWSTFGSTSTVSGPVLRERTRDQEIEYSTASQSGNNALTNAKITGVAEVDVIIARYRAPLSIGSV